MTLKTRRFCDIETARDTTGGKLKAAVIAAAALAVLTGCNGIDAASKSTEQFAYRLNFKQIPLIDDDTAPGRTMNMHVFQGSSGQVPRATQQVPFYAQLQP